MADGCSSGKCGTWQTANEARLGAAAVVDAIAGSVSGSSSCHVSDCTGVGLGAAHPAGRQPGGQLLQGASHARHRPPEAWHPSRLLTTASVTQTGLSLLKRVQLRACAACMLLMQQRPRHNQNFAVLKVSRSSTACAKPPRMATACGNLPQRLPCHQHWPPNTTDKLT